MSELIAGVAIPETSTTAETTQLMKETANPLLFHHSRRVFLFGTIHARTLGLDPDPELLYVAAMFHDSGLLTPFSNVQQRFEIDGADHARAFLAERGFATQTIDIVWTAIALHTTPGLPGRMGPEAAATNLGVLTDAVGLGLDKIDPALVDEIIDTHPRGDFKDEFLKTLYDGLKDRPDTAYGTVNADVLEHFDASFRRTTMVDRVIASPWPT